jgi:RecG-like helicase
LDYYKKQTKTLKIKKVKKMNEENKHNVTTYDISRVKDYLFNTPRYYEGYLFINYFNEEKTDQHGSILLSVDKSRGGNPLEIIDSLVASIKEETGVIYHFPEYQRIWERLQYEIYPVDAVFKSKF